MTGTVQGHTAPQDTPHAPIYISTNTPMPLRYLETTIDDSAAATWRMTTTSDAKASQIDTQCIRTASVTDKESERRYVVFDVSGSV